MYRASPAHSPYVFLAFGNAVIALERRSGRGIWQWTMPVSRTTNLPVRLEFVPDRLIVAVEKELACLTLDRGQQVWHARSPLFASSFMLDGDEIFVGNSGEAAAFDVQTGAMLWHHPFKGMGLGVVSFGVPGHVRDVPAGA